jgi:two-component system, sensor histidine kinase FlrB
MESDQKAGSHRAVTQPAMPNLPTTRQTMRSSVADADGQNQIAAQEHLARAFLTFTRAAGSLEKSYLQLQTEVGRLHQELHTANSELQLSLEENARVRTYLSRVLENLPCGVLVINAENKIQTMNPEARNLLGVPASGVDLKGVSLPASLVALFPVLLADASHCEQEWYDPDTTANRTIGISRANVSEGGSGPSDTIWILRDVTEEKRIASEREAARRSRALAEIATVLAHEIRNPLGSMELFTSLLAEATADRPETRPWTNHLQAGLRSLSATVNNVLQFHSQPAPQIVPTDLGRLLHETVDFLRPLARQRGQQIRFENVAGHMSLQADPNRLKQVVFNLALNAFRAMLVCGKLTVRASWAELSSGKFAQVDFEDEGRGVPEGLLESIFQPGVSSTPGSPGLGLSVCKQLVEQHGGEIRVKSEVDRGTTFSIFLPVLGAAE